MKKKELTPLKRALYLLEDIPVSVGMLRRELPAEDRRALAEGLEAARRQFAAAGSESDLQRAASDLLSLVESRETWRRLLLPAAMPGIRQREQWLEVREQELQANPEKAMGVEDLRKMLDNIELRFEAITPLLAGDENESIRELRS
ncbi:MAG: hypothetical protein ACE5LU_03335 [Anaerolineae bacterium]